MNGYGRTAEHLGLNCGAWRDHSVRRDALIYRESKVIDIQLEEEVLDYLNRVVRNLKFDDTLARILFQSHHCSVHLNTSCLFLIANLCFLNHRFEWRLDESRAYDRSCHCSGVASSNI